MRTEIKSVLVGPNPAGGGFGLFKLVETDNGNCDLLYLYIKMEMSGFSFACGEFGTPTYIDYLFFPPQAAEAGAIILLKNPASDSAVVSY